MIGFTQEAHEIGRGVMAELVEMGGARVLVCDVDGPVIDTVIPVTDLVGEALSTGASVIAIPAARLSSSFFHLRSGLAGEVSQKVVNYRMRLAVVGDVSLEIARSEALHDWVVECNRGRQVWFVDDIAALAARLEVAG
jgi:hypothetical protein